jgi:ligand-binding SRPBCC domain-containing protein
LRYHRLERSQTLQVSIGRVFSFFEAAENLALITPPSLGFRVVSPTPVVMEEGRVIDYRIRLCGLPVRWRSLISDYEPPFGFVDEQLQGPYAHWRHTHRFESCLRGTLVKDDVVYALPGGLPSALESTLHSLYVRPSLERIFDYRCRFYADFFDDRCG